MAGQGLHRTQNHSKHWGDNSDTEQLSCDSQCLKIKLSLPYNQWQVNAVVLQLSMYIV